jgi:imidazolonepropionase-like amidohydrolase
VRHRHLPYRSNMKLRTAQGILLIVALAGTVSARCQEQTLVLRGGNLFDAVADEARPNHMLTMRGGRFVGTDRVLSEEELEQATVIELTDEHWILPGFFDLHAHYAIDLFGKGRVDEMAAYPLLFLANGVTSTFPAGEMNPDGMRELRLRLNSGKAIGPRLFNSGPYFGRWRKGWNNSITADELRAEVDHWAAQGVTGFKAKSISPKHLRVLVDRAHAHGLTVTGHVDSGYRGSVNPRDAIEMGIDRIEHFMGGDAMPATQSAYASLVSIKPEGPEFERICDLFIERGVYFDATMSAFGYFGERDPEVFTPWIDERSFLTPYMRALIEERPPRPPMATFEAIYWAKRDLLLGFYERGGGPWITVGTDHPSWGDYLPSFGYHRELHCLRLAGLPVSAVLKAATINGARALGLGDRLGTIEAGKLADCVVVKGDPWEDIQNTHRCHLVVKAGQLFQIEKLLEQARGRIGPLTEEDLNSW